jgi:hypothetical protein
MFGEMSVNRKDCAHRILPAVLLTIDPWPEMIGISSQRSMSRIDGKYFPPVDQTHDLPTSKITYSKILCPPAKWRQGSENLRTSVFIIKFLIGDTDTELMQDTRPKGSDTMEKDVMQGCRV